MIDVVTEWLQSQYNSNDFLIGTTVPFVLASIVMGMRTFVRSLYNYIVRNFTVSIRIDSDTEKFIEINQYVYDNFVWGMFKRNFVLSWLWSQDRLNMTSGYGRSVAMVHGFPGFIELTQEKSDAHAFKKFLEIKVLTYRPTAMSTRLFDELHEYVEQCDGRKANVNIFKSSSEGRVLVTKKPLRSLNSVFVPDELKTRVIGSLRKFIDSKEAYERQGLPYHMGLILHGPPGTGKTSFIHAIASELGLGVHYHSSGSLTRAHVDADNTILVLEDFDSAGFETSDAGKKTTISTLTDTLNYLDGFLTPHGLIVIATTNHLDRIDPAVMRPGRFDLVEEVPAMDREQYEKMCEFYGVKPEDDFTSKSGAALMAEIKGRWVSDEAPTE